MSTDLAKSKPSRSEIERAVRGNQRQPSSVNERSTELERALDGSASRRQQVIGGDLTGISRRRTRPSLFSRILEINYINVIAVLIVLSILGVFFWPSSNPNAVREVSQQQTPTVSGYQGLERVDAPEENAPTETAFSQDSDLQRANEFRLQDKQTKQIEALLAQAQNHIAAGEYSRPPGNNAVSRYRQVLQIDANNRTAKEGLQFIQGRFLASGLNALAAGDQSIANATLSKIRAIEAESEQGYELEAAINQWQTEQRIGELSLLAGEARKANQLILPARASALFYYQEILAIKPDHVPAQQGISSIADEFVNKANAAVFAGRYEAATGYLATVSVIDAKHPSIPLIEAMIAKAKPLSARRNQNLAQSEQTQQNNRTNNNPLPVPERVSNNRTPSSVSRERQAFDRQYLQQGLQAYYQGDYEKAIGLLQPLADKGIARAQFRIGYMHYLGRGLTRDRQKADEIIRTALPAVQRFADEGRAWAQSDIGSLYEDGLVLNRDYAEAIYWYRSAAEQGYAGAQTNLGVMYAQGRGVAANRQTAIQWFQRAAKQGDVAARRNLETMGINP